MTKESTKTLTTEQVKKELEAKKDRIEQRLGALQEEITSVGPSIREEIFGHPLVKLGGALLAGLAVGLIVGGTRRKEDAFGAGAGHRALVDHYVDAVVEEARHRAAQGQDLGKAVRAALDERVPLIVYEVPDSEEKTGLMGHAMRLVLWQAVPMALRMGLDYLLPDLGEGGAPEA